MHLHAHKILPHPTYTIHVYTVGIWPGVLVALYQSVTKTLGYDMKSDELLDTGHLLMVLLSTLVQSQHDGRHITKYGSTH